MLVLNENKELRPLNDATLIDDVEWGVLIGFDMDPNNILPVEKHNYVNAKNFDECSFTAKDVNRFPRHEVLTCGNICDNARCDTPLPIFFGY